MVLRTTEDSNSHFPVMVPLLAKYVCNIYCNPSNVYSHVVLYIKARDDFIVS